jgi:GDP-D-mannose 3',5'-epimerase
MKCLICGGLGFIGSHLANYLAVQGVDVRVADIKKPAECYLPLRNVEMYNGFDLRTGWEAEEVVHGMDWVFQLAADMGGMGYIHDNRACVMRNNALINMNVLEASRLAGVKRIFYSSSACAYPEYRQMDTDSPALKESDVYPAQPDTFYGWEKLFSEKLYESYVKDYGMAVRVARLHNVYGPYGTYKGGREKAPAALCRKVAEAKDGTQIEVWGDGKAMRSYLYVDDCIEAILRLMNSNCNIPLNIGTDIAISVDELAKLIIDISGKKLGIVHDTTKPEGVRGRNADLTLVKRTLGWSPTVNYEEGLSKLYHWVNRQVNG